MPIGNAYANPPDRDGGATILIVDDELGVRIRHEELCKQVDGEDIRILSCSSSSDALEIISSTLVHVVLLDKRLGPNEETDPRHNGIEAIPEMLLINPHLQILVITGSFVKLVDDVVTAMRYGALGFALKGGKKQDDVIVLQIKNAIKVAKLTLEKAREAFAPSTQNDTQFEFAGDSKAVRHLFKQIEAFSESNRPVLITGESGSGKSLTARLIHERRKKYLNQEDRPFIHLSVASLGHDSVEEMVFGREQIGAERKITQGFFELANTGTLFIDEVAELPLSIQAKFLTIIEDGIFYRIGGTQKLKTSFKLVCATSKNLDSMVKEGKFNEGFYQRVSTFPIRVPSLSERKEDIPAIVSAILPKCCRDNNVFVTFEDLPNEFVEFLSENILASNVRGIEDQIARLLVLSPKDTKGMPQFKNWRKIPGLQPFLNGKGLRPSRASITVKELMTLPFDVEEGDFPGYCQLMELIEKKLILEAKTHFKTNRALSRFLKISDATITYHLKKIGKTEASSINLSLETRQGVAE